MGIKLAAISTIYEDTSVYGVIVTLFIILLILLFLFLVSGICATSASASSSTTSTTTLVPESESTTTLVPATASSSNITAGTASASMITCIMADPQPSIHPKIYCTGDNISATSHQVVIKSTLVTTIIDAETEQGAEIEESQIDTPPSTSGFKRFKKRVRKGLKNLCCLVTSADE